MLGPLRFAIGTGYDPVARRYFDAMSVAPSMAARRTIDRLVRGLRSDGMLDRLAFFLMAQATEQAALLNLVNPAQSASNVGGMTFDPLYGWSGNASSSYLNSGTMLTAGGLFTQDDCVEGANCNLESAFSGERYVFGIVSATSPRMAARNNNSTEVFQVNDSSNDTARTGASRLGHRAMGRRATQVGSKLSWYQGAANGPIARASLVAPPNVVATLGRAGSFYSDDRYDFWYFGASLSDAQMLNLHNRVTAALAALRGG